jgi:hypothetical protein
MTTPSASTWFHRCNELETENETLRAALERVEEWTWEPGYERHALADLQNIARAALAAARGGDAA